MSEKRSRSKFCESVRKCISRSRRGPYYRKSLPLQQASTGVYASLQHYNNSDESGTAEGVEEESKPHMTAYLLIEKIVKQDKIVGKKCFGF